MIAVGLALQVGSAESPRGEARAKVDYARDIRPILADNCYACHGPDEKTRKAGLRVDDRQAAFAPLQSGARAIEPHKPAESRLIQRINTSDPDDVMPPRKTGKTLNKAQRSLLERWVREGADWPGHWAFEPIKRASIPKAEGWKAARNGIDSFVAAGLNQEKVRPSPPADKNTLLRRVSLDLTGLPPTIEEVDAFLADKSPGAYEKLVDRLLESPRYGEHMAKYWLDAVRYADSHGYHIDAQRDIWAYRDWVIKAFNANLPFDQFTVQQIAGDLLPGAGTSEKVATGYVRCNMSTGEGGAIDAEYQAKYAFDRVETTSTVWLGLTMVCARCHTHKYDPIPQADYYGLYAFFNNLDEPAMDGNKPNPDPFMKLPSKEQSRRLDWLREHLAEGRKRSEAPDEKLDAAQAEWAQRWHQKLRENWQALEVKSAVSTRTNGAHLRQLGDGTLLAEGSNPEQETFEILCKPAGERLAAVRLDAVPHESLPKRGTARAEDGRFELSTLEAEILGLVVDGKPAPPKKVVFTQADATASRGDQGADNAIDDKAETAWSVDPAEPAATQSAIFVPAEPLELPASAELRVRLKFETPKAARAIGHFRLWMAREGELMRLLNPPRFGPWHVIGPFKTEGLLAGFTNVYEPEKLVALDKAYPGVREEIRWSARGDLEDGKTHLLVNELHGVHGAYFLYRTVNLPSPAKMELGLRADTLFKLWVNGTLALESGDPDRPPGVALKGVVELKAGENRILVKVVNHQGAAYFAFKKDSVDAEAPSPMIAGILSLAAHGAGEWKPRLQNYFRRQTSVEFRSLFNEINRWQEEEEAINSAIPTTLIAKEAASPRDTLLLMRGEYDKPGSKVAAHTPSILPPLPPDEPTNRLGLARWLVHPSHPLTARVIVNRFWQQYFGVGLVKTAEDFGAQGERPSHPELLDWLASEFIRSGWDVKRLQKLILTSATYQQSARITPALQTRDPENRLLARGPRFRVDAEALRDSILSISGLLVDQCGGRSVKPYEPPGLWEAVSFNNAQKYVPEPGAAQYRRSLYTYWKRQSPPPNMLILDAPTREYCVARRPRTNTPLQALALLNDPQFVEASRALGCRMLVEGGSDDRGRIAYGFRLATGRAPNRRETRVLLNLLGRQRSIYQADGQAALKLLSVGQFHPATSLDSAELAAWTNLASLLLNLDETITKG